MLYLCPRNKERLATMSQENTSQSKSAAKVSQFFRTCKKNEEVGDLLFNDGLISW